MTFGSRQTNLPELLPPRYLVGLSALGRLNLFLDYDGTLAPIVKDPSRAIPYPGVTNVLNRLGRCRKRVVVAIVTGRPIEEIERLLGSYRSMLFSGIHGMEVRDSRGFNRLIPAARGYLTSLAEASRWLERNVPPERGFRIEIKRVSVGLHYRQADQKEARVICAKFADFVRTRTPNLRLLYMKKVLEVVPKGGGKGNAVKSLKRRLSGAGATVYFGDDTTDEEAFAALGANDVGILVGAKRPTLAHYYVSNQGSVVRQLSSLADALGK